MKDIEKAIDIDDTFSKKNLELSDKLAAAIFEMSVTCRDQFIQLTKSIIQDCVDVLNRHDLTPPCPFAVFGLGSVACGKATPYSDLKYGFVVESDPGNQYFNDLAVESYFQINNIGETSLKCLDIEDCSIIQHSLSAAPVGYRLDGISPKAGNIPTGRDNKQGLIFTVDGFLEKCKESSNITQKDIRGDLSDLLSSTVLIYSYMEAERLYQTITDATFTYSVFCK